MGNAISGFIHDQEIRIWGNEWLERVADKKRKQQPTDDGTSADDIHWKPLDKWVEVYEPPRQESDRERRVKEAVEHKAQEVLFEAMDRRIVTRILRLLLDVASQILSQAELLSSSLDNTTTARILNNMNGIVLTYRFESDEEDYKIQFLRRTATDNLTRVLWDECLPNQDTAATLVKVQSKLKNTLLQLKNEVVPVVLAKLNDLFVQVDNEVDRQVEERLGNSKVSLAFEERLLQIDAAANQVMQKTEDVATLAQHVAVTADETVDIVIGDEVVGSNIQQTLMEAASQAAAAKEATIVQASVAKDIAYDNALKLGRAAIAVKNDALLKKSQVAANFADLVKSLILSKLEDMTSSIMNIVDKILLAFYEIHLLANVAESKSTHSLEEIQSEIYKRVELLAIHVKGLVEDEVRAVSGTILSIITHPEREEDVKAQELEGKRT